MKSVAIPAVAVVVVVVLFVACNTSMFSVVIELDWNFDASMPVHCPNVFLSAVDHVLVGQLDSSSHVSIDVSLR
jgi:hypothetical protein